MIRKGLHRRYLFFLLSTFLFMVLCHEAAAQQDWISKNWPYRRAVRVEGEIRGASAAYVEFSHCGFSASDGRDILITAGPRREVKSKVVSCGFDDGALVAFELQKDVYEYYVYFGNKRAKKTIREWEPTGGLLLEVRAMGSGSADTLDEMFSLLSHSPRVLGRDFRNRPAVGLNPYGPKERYILIMSGYVRLPETGEYVFAVNSRDASFALVDGNLVASWPGRHGSDAYAAEDHSRRVLLSRGRHSLTLFNAAFDHGGVALGVKTPSGQGVRPFQGNFLHPIVKARAGILERIDHRNMTDFIWFFEGDLGLEDLDATHVSFRNDSILNKKRVKSCRWDFGDGQTGEGEEVEHVYLQGGTYTVTMSLDFDRGGRMSASRRIRVQPRGVRNKEIQKGRQEYLDSLVAICEKYDLEFLTVEASATLAKMAEYADRSDLRVKVLEGVFSADELPDAFGDSMEAIEYGRDLLITTSSYEKAARVFLNAARAGANHNERQMGYLCAAEVQLYYLGNADEAEALLFEAKSKHLRLGQSRDRWVALRLGDLMLARGDRDGAVDQYDRVQGVPFKRRRAGDRAFSRGDFYTAFHSHLKAGELEGAEQILRDWEMVMPALKGEGELTHAWAKLMAARSKWRPAVRQLEWTLELVRETHREPAVLLDLASCHEALGEEDRALVWYRRIMEEHPLSLESKTAEEKLDQEP